MISKTHTTKEGNHYKVYRGVENPTLGQRVDFLETMLRRTGVHETMCDRNFPDMVGPFWNWKYVYQPCNCWLTDPFGSSGIQLDYEFDSLDKETQKG